MQIKYTMRRFLYTAAALLVALIWSGCATPERPPSGTVYVITSVLVKPDAQAEFIELFNALAPTVRAEAGCIEYMMDDERLIDPTNGEILTLAILEKWANLDAVRAHRDSAHMLQFEKDYADLVEDVSRIIMKQE
jgi:quinol monooxygenase YgiN